MLSINIQKRGEGVCSSLPEQEVAGSSPVVSNPEKGALRTQLVDESMQSLPVDSAE